MNKQKYTREEAFNETLKYFNGDQLAANVFLNKYALKDSFDNLYEKTPDDMHRRLAKEFARIEEKYDNPVSEDDIYELLKNFKYIIPQGSPMSGIGNENQIVSLSNCFVEGTNIYTVNGVKKIENVKIGDIVNTQEGKLKPVVQLHKNELNDRTIYNLKVYKTPKINVTGNHKFLSISKEQLEWGLPIQENSVEYLRKGDYIAIPNQKEFQNIEKIYLSDMFNENLTYEDKSYKIKFYDNKTVQFFTNWSDKNGLNKTKSHNIINSEWVIDESFMYFIGLWYGDGCIFSNSKSNFIRNRKGKHKNGVRGITFTFGIHEEKLSNFVVEYGEKLFGLKADINYNNEQNTTQIVFHSSAIGIAFEMLFGRYSYGKILNKMFYKFDNTLINNLLQGLIDSDGTITKDGDVRVTLANKELITSFYHLFRNRGIVVGFSETKNTARIDFQKNSNYINTSNKYYKDDRILKSSYKNKSNLFTIEYDGYTLLKIENKELTDLKPKYVYTFGVEDIHSYSVEGLISMNCFVIGNNADSYSGIIRIDEELVNLMKRRGGVGTDLSHIRPSGTQVKNSALSSTGLVPFMDRYSNSTREVAQDGRRGALMLSCFSPETYVLVDYGWDTILNVINKIKNGEIIKAWTHDGYQVITDTQEFDDKDIYEIETENGKKIKVTANHEFVVRNTQTGDEYLKKIIDVNPENEELVFFDE